MQVRVESDVKLELSLKIEMVG